MEKEQNATPTTAEALEAVEVINQACEILEAYGASYVVSIETETKEKIIQKNIVSLKTNHLYRFLNEIVKNKWMKNNNIASYAERKTTVFNCLKTNN